MTTEVSQRLFEPGTTGWCAADLDDPAIEAQWESGSFEIINGVLTTMAPAYFTGGNSLYKLMHAITSFQSAQNIGGEFSIEVDIIIDEMRVAKADAVWMTPEELHRQDEAGIQAGKKDPRRARILVPPSLIIESISPGHERHDERLKRQWYAEFGVQNYWLLNAFERTLNCLRLENGRYISDASGKSDETVRPAMFHGLELNLKSLWLQT